MSVTYNFSGKTILITGATGGIGKTLVRGFSELGAHVIIHDKNEETAKEIFADINDASYISADFSHDEEIQSMIKTLSHRYDALHVLINNAGIEIRKPYEEFLMEEYDKILDINIRSIFQITKGMFPLLKNAKDASVINISSIHQKLPYPTNLPYSMSKAAMGMFAEIVGVEWAPYNIRVNNIAPGAIETDMNKEIIQKIGYGIFASWIGSGKIGNTQDVLQACFFLASEASRYMTGETLFIDGALSKGLLPYGHTLAMQTMKKNLLNQDEHNE